MTFGAYDNELLAAADSGDANRVADLLDKGADVNAKDNDSFTPLHLAAINDHLNVVEKLIEKGADVNAKDNFNYTPLHLAVSYGHLNVVEKLIEKGADVNVKNNNKGFTPLHEAAISGYLNVVKKLIEKGAKVYDKNNYGLTPLELANNKNNAEIVNLFVCYKDKHHYTLLHHAAKDNNANLVDLLLDRGADVNAKDNDSFTPLYLAAIDDHLNVVEKLIEKGADINAKNNNGDTLLHWAARNNNSEVAEFFMSKHADVNTKNKDDWTPLHFAAACGNLNVVELILDKRDDVDAIGALTVANTLSKENSSEIASLLEERIRKNEGITQHLNSQEEGSSLSIDAHNRHSIAKEDENSLQNDKIDLSKIGVTSRTSKPSSFINIFVYTTVDTVKGVFQFISSSFKAAIGMQPSKAITVQGINTDGILLLLGVFISKITGQKYISTVNQSMFSLEAQGYALNIIEEFEKIVEQAALKSGISMHRLNIDYMGMQKEVTGKIMSSKFNEIPKVLNSYVEQACHDRETGKLSPKKFNKFMVVFNKGLDLIVNQSMQQILHNRDSTLEVEEQQINLEPQSYLSNTSVQGHLTQDRGLINQGKA